MAKINNEIMVRFEKNIETKITEAFKSFENDIIKKIAFALYYEEYFFIGAFMKDIIINDGDINECIAAFNHDNTKDFFKMAEKIYKLEL